MIRLNAKKLDQANWPAWTIEASKVWVVRAKRRVYYIALVKPSDGYFRSSSDYPKGYGVREMQRNGSWFDVGYGLSSRAHALALIRADLEEAE